MTRKKTSAAKAPETTILTDDERDAAIREVAHNAAFTAYMQEIGATLGLASESALEEAKEHAASAAKAAAKRGVKGPYLTDTERAQIYRNNLRAQEMAIIAEDVRAEAGLPHEREPKLLAEQHEKLLAIAPEGISAEEIARAADSGHPGVQGPRREP
jgi:hypothetical protein